MGAERALEETIGDRLARIDEITEEEILNFRNTRVQEDLRDIFDEYTSNKQRIFVIVDSFSSFELEELKELAEKEEESGRRVLTGLHNLRGIIAVLSDITKDEKYKNL